jgi:hypothetical protein
VNWLRGRASRKNRLFKLSGGRAGTVQYDSDGCRAELSWEMLVGEFDMVVYTRGSRWVIPEERSMTEDEVRELVKKLAREMKINIELALSHETELFRWRDAV